MFFRRVVVGVGVAAFGLAVGAVPVFPGVASAHPAFCALNKHAASVQSKTGAAVVKALESGNWPAAQKGLITEFGKVNTAEKAAIAALSGAPRKVKAAGATMIGFAKTEVKIVRASTSATGFESALETAAQSPKIQAAEKALTAFFDNKCGIPQTTTLPT
jgi:hypothetical protein